MPDRRDDPPGPGDAWGPSMGFLAVAIGLGVGALAWWWSSRPPVDGPEGEGAAGAAVAASAASAPVAFVLPRSAPARPPAAPAPRALPPAPGASLPMPPAPRIARQRGPDEDQSPDLRDYVNEGEVPTMAQVIDRLHQAGVYTGLGAFNPPGTRPPRMGLAVPDDFVLPEGYVRHYQATDDGQRIEPVLMFSPDYQFLDAAHRPIPIPEDRVVPPEMAPPGLPIRRIVIPPPRDPSPGG